METYIEIDVKHMEMVENGSRFISVQLKRIMMKHKNEKLRVHFHILFSVLSPCSFV